MLRFVFMLFVFAVSVTVGPANADPLNLILISSKQTTVRTAA